MDTKLKGKVALITGASRGIGEAISTQLAKEGVNVALLGRDSEKLAQTEQACQEFGVKVLKLECDLTDIPSLSSVIQQTVENLGQLNILINNAGIGSWASVDQADLKAWDRVIDTNLRSMVHLTRYSLPEIGKGNWGAVINISSVAGKQTCPSAGIYSATKHAVMGFTGSLFEDVREKNIKVCAICPGFVNTEMVVKKGLDGKKMIQPEDIAKTVSFVLNFPDTGCPTEIMVRPQRSPY